MKKEYVVIGNSVAGLSAVRAIRAIDREGSITVVSEERHLPYSRVLLTHYVAGKLRTDDLFLIQEAFYQKMRVRLLRGVRAVRVVPGERGVELDDGRWLRYDAVLVATGARPYFPAVFARGPEGVLGLRTLEDAVRIREAALSGSQIAIVGGGPVGIKLACALQEAGLSPTLLVSSPHILSQVADQEAAAIIERHLARAGVRVRCGVNVEELVAGRRGLQALMLSDGSVLACDMVVVCKGVRPQVELVAGRVRVRRGVVVDAGMRTSAPGVFAAGDVVEVRDLITGEERPSAIWPHAAAQGRVAGTNMAGGRVAFPGALQRNALEVLGLPVVAMGVTRVPADPAWECVITRSKVAYRKLVLKRGRLVGAVLVGDVEGAGIIQAAIRRGDAGWRQLVTPRAS